MTAILIGKHCRLCRALIPNSIAGQPLNVVAAKINNTSLPVNPGKATFGSEESGYLCEKCMNDERAKLHKLANQVDEFWRKEVYVDMGAAIAPPCAKCGTLEGNERVLEDYEGAKAMLCRKCGTEYLRANRDKIRGTLLEWKMKLK